MKANRELRRTIVSVILAVFIKAAVFLLVSLLTRNDEETNFLSTFFLSEFALFMLSLFIFLTEDDKEYAKREAERYFDRYTILTVISLGFDAMLILFVIIALIIEAIKKYIDD